MRWLVWYIRSLFCRHEFHFDEGKAENDFVLWKVSGIKVVRTCKKCGWVVKYWKR